MGMGRRKQAKENGEISITVAWIFSLYFIPFVLWIFFNLKLCVTYANVLSIRATFKFPFPGSNSLLFFASREGPRIIPATSMLEPMTRYINESQDCSHKTGFSFL